MPGKTGTAAPARMPGSVRVPVLRPDGLGRGDGGMDQQAAMDVLSEGSPGSISQNVSSTIRPPTDEGRRRTCGLRPERGSRPAGASRRGNSRAGPAERSRGCAEDRELCGGSRPWSRCAGTRRDSPRGTPCPRCCPPSGHAPSRRVAADRIDQGEVSGIAFPCRLNCQQISMVARTRRGTPVSPRCSGQACR